MYGRADSMPNSLESMVVCGSVARCQRYIRRLLAYSDIPCRQYFPLHRLKHPWQRGYLYAFSPRDLHDCSS